MKLSYGTILFLVATMFCCSALAQESPTDEAPAADAPPADTPSYDTTQTEEQPVEAQPAEAPPAEIAPAEEPPAEPASEEAAPIAEEPVMSDAELEAALKEMDAVEEPAAEEKKPEKEGESLLTSLGNHFRLYGFLRMDIAYDTSRSEYGNWALWVLPNRNFTRVRIDPKDEQNSIIERVTPNNNNELNITPRTTRFGLELKGEKIGSIGAEIKGKVEIDFYGGDRKKADWAAVPRWRKAYLALDWGWFELRAGQDADIMSSLYPNSANPGADWFMGNLGGRRPQLELNFKPEVGDEGRIWAQISIGRPGPVAEPDFDITFGKDENYELDLSDYTMGDGNNDGEDSGIPMIQWRLAYQGKLWTNKDFIIGASGHYSVYSFRRRLWSGAENDIEYDTKEYFVKSYSMSGELQLPFFDWWVMRGEFFYGESLHDVYGNIAQSINKESLIDGLPEGIAGYGFWADMTFDPFDFWTIAIGYMNDTPDENTMPSRLENYKLIEESRYKNRAAFIHNKFSLGKGFVTGFTYFHMMTDYKYVKDERSKQVKTYTASNERFHLYFAYGF